MPFTRKAVHSMALAASSRDVVPKGKFKPLAGKCVPELEIELQIPLANTSGGTVNLTDAEIRTLLAQFFCTLQMGHDDGDFPIKDKDLSVVMDLGRYVLKTRPRGYADTVDGPKMNLPNSATTTVTIGIRIPTGRINRIRQFKANIGMGPTQCGTISLEVRRGAAVAPHTGVALSGNTTVNIFMVEESCVGDPWALVPEIVEKTEASRTVELQQESLLLAVTETTAVHLSTSLTEFHTEVDGEITTDRTDPEQYIETLLMDADLPAAADISDVVTVLHQLPGSVDLERDPESVFTGKFKLIDEQNSLATKNLRAFVIKLRDPAYWRAVHRFVAGERKTRLKSPSQYAVRGLTGKVHDRFQPYFGAVFFAEGERQAEQFVALWGGANENPVPFVPEYLKAAADQAKALPAVMQDRALGQIAAGMMGAVASSRGGKAGSEARADVARRLGLTA